MKLTETFNCFFKKITHDTKTKGSHTYLVTYSYVIFDHFLENKW